MTRARILLAGIAQFAIAGIAISITACSGAPSAQEADGNTLMAASTPPDAVMEALITGTLTTTESGCFAVASGDVTYPLQFPYGTVLSDDGRTVKVPGHQPLEVGDEIRGGGGYVHLDTVPAGCEAQNEYDEYAVWQTLDD